MDVVVGFLPLIFFLIALLYSSVGHGGASGYLAIMGLLHMVPETMKPAALLMNVFVSMIAFIRFSGVTELPRGFFIALVAGSMPAAFFGAMIPVSDEVYRKILGVMILIAAIRLTGFFNVPERVIRVPDGYIAVLVGLAIGLVSGITGIGGGIVLSPLLLIMGWAGLKQTALMSALFIFLNSISGLLGLAMTGFMPDKEIFYWTVAAFCGGLVGSWIGSRKLPPAMMKKALAVVLIFAGIKLILQ